MKKVSKRSIARLMAVQTLYQYHYHEGKNDILEIMDEIVDNYTIDSDKNDIGSWRKKTDINFLRNLVSGVLLVLNKLDQEIIEFSNKDNNIEQSLDVMMQILRLGVFELRFMKDIPFKSVINEYADIANSFYDRKKVNFVNAVLNKAAKSDN